MNVNGMLLPEFCHCPGLAPAATLAAGPTVWGEIVVGANLASFDNAFPLPPPPWDDALVTVGPS